MILDFGFIHSVSVETLTGNGTYGPVFAAPSVVDCFVNDSTKMVRDAKGDEVVSSTTLYAPLTASPGEPPAAGQFAPGSRVTVNGRSALVLSTARRDAGELADLAHVEVALT